MISALTALALAAEPTERYALLVGHNDGGPDRVRLRYAHADADSLATVLEELGGVPSDHETVLRDPSRAELQAAFAAVERKLATSPNSEILFYYSGHSNEQGLLLGTETVGYKELRGWMDELPARVRVGILDSCASGALILTKGGVSVPAFLQDEATSIDGTAYITSSSADEVSQEAERIGGSFFTHHLASGLRGAADATGDGRVTLHEAYAYANAETLAETERSQYGPQHATHLYQMTGTGEFVLTDLALTSASLVLDETVAGRTSVRDQDGELVIELTKLPGRPVELGLDEGPYTVIVQGPNDTYAEAEVVLSVGASALVGADALVWYAGSSAVARGDLIVGGEPPIAAIVPASEPDLTRRLLPRFGFVPGMPPAPVGVDTFVLSIVSDRSIELDGFATALVDYQVEGRARGSIVTLASTRVGELDGAQVTLGVNVSERESRGFQASIGGNVGVSGGDLVQAAVGANVATEELRGGQLSVGVNVAESFRGAQITSGVNVAALDSAGLQLSSGVNVARGLFDGVQLSIVNVGKDVKGAQIGLVNIGRDVKGAQIGLVNVARDVDGAGVGLLSFEKNGRHDVLLYGNETDDANAELRFGSDRFYTVLGGGADKFVGTDRAHAGGGLGLHLGSEPVWADLDATAWAYARFGGATVVGDNGVSGSIFDAPPATVYRLRATVGVQVAKELAPFLGASMNVQYPSDEDNRVAPGWTGEGDVIGWPGFFAGVQF